jgi:type I restriction enzyme M protein
MEKLVTVKDAAGILGVSAATLRNWDRSGRLKARRHPINSYRMYPLKEVLALQKTLTLWPMAEPDAVGEPAATQIGRAELRKLVRSLHRDLRDSDGNSSLVERFDELAKIVFLKIGSEQRPELAAHADFLGPGDDQAVSLRARRAFDRLVKENPRLFPVRFKKLDLGDAALARICRSLGAVTLSGSAEDVKGLLFEEVIADTFEKGDNQQFFTPSHVVQFMVDFVGSALRGQVADPACGTGGFLIAAASRMKGTLGKAKADGKLWGLEIDSRLAWAAGINLHIHGFPSFEIVHLEGAGTLGPDVVQQLPPIDAIITNPPFGSDLTDAEALCGLELGAGRKSRRRGVLFVERSLSLLKPGGVLAIVIDDGVLNGPTNSDVRNLLLSQADVAAVVGLPEVAFMPYATVKASILFVQKHGGRQARLKSERGSFFASAEQVGRKPSGDPLYKFNRVSRKLVLDSDLPDILQAWEGKEKDFKQGYWADIPKISDPDYVHALHRLDLPFHHPARSRALRMLLTSPYPLSALSDLCEMRSDSLIPSEQCEDEEITYVGLANLESQTGFASPVVVPGSTLKSSVKRFFAGDILFAKMRPELRKVARVPEDVVEGVCSAECVVLVPKSGDLFLMMPELLAYLLRSDLVYGQLVHQVMGIGRPRLRPADIMAVRVPVPPKGAQESLLAKLEQAEAASGALAEEAELAAAKATHIRVEAVEFMTKALLGAEDRRA